MERSRTLTFSSSVLVSSTRFVLFISSPFYFPKKILEKSLLFRSGVTNGVNADF